MEANLECKTKRKVCLGIVRRREIFLASFEMLLKKSSKQSA